jgi:hypothetical protein
MVAIGATNRVKMDLAARSTSQLSECIDNKPIRGATCVAQWALKSGAADQRLFFVYKK